MKRLSLLSLLLGLSFGMLFAQSARQVRLTYEYVNIGLNERRTVTLLATNNESLTTFSAKDSLETSREEKNDFNLEADDETGRQVYKNTATNQIVFRDFIPLNGKFTPCIVRETMNPLKWNFTSQTRKIGVYTCKLAEVSFRGRVYRVWFSNDLPVSHGPWKFHGLPGGVVEIRSADENIAFALQKVETVSSLPITIPTEGTEVTMEEYVAVKQNEIKEFIKALSARLPRGAQIDVVSTNDHNLEIDFSDVNK